MRHGCRCSVGVPGWRRSRFDNSWTGRGMPNKSRRRRPVVAVSKQTEDVVRDAYSGRGGNRADRMAELLAQAERRLAQIDPVRYPGRWAAAMLDLGHTRTRQIYGDPKERFEAAL